MVGSGALDAISAETHAEKTQQELKQFDSDLSSLGWQNDTKETVYLGGDSELVTDGELTVNISDGYASNETTIDLETIVSTDEAGNEFAYQAGGVWRIDNDRARAVADPNIRYYTEMADGEQVGRLDLSPMTVEGTVGSGEHTVESGTTQEFDLRGDELEYVNYVTVEVSDSAYHNGWYDFLKDEFNATDEANVPGHDCKPATQVTTNIICHEEDQQTVTVVAGVDGETPLANLVDIDPTVYGGLYVSGTDKTVDSPLTVTAYDDHQSTQNVTNDLLLADYENYDLQNHANIDGIPVVNGELGSKGNPTISQIGYGVSVDPGPQGRPFEEDNAYWLDTHEQALATELSSSYTSIDSINDEIDTLLDEYLRSDSTAGGSVTAGIYEGLENDGNSISTLDSSDGNIHVGVEDDLELSGVDVYGDNQTSFYVDGNVDVSNVEIHDGDRASSLWIYATNDSTVTVDGDFQGVIYAPGANVQIDGGTTIDGAVVAGNDVGIEDNVHVNFDRSLRTDTPFSDGDEDLLFEYGESRPPIDATFILDSSGSMGPHNPSGNTYSPVESVRVSDDDWEPLPGSLDEPFRNAERHLTVEIRNTTSGEAKQLEYHDYANPDNWNEIRVLGERCSWWGGCTDETALGMYNQIGNDAYRERVNATTNFIDLMNESEGDRAGVYEFDTDGNTLHHLDGDLDAAKENVVGNAYGGTNMSAGLEKALDDYDYRGKEGQEKIAILLSDGKNSGDGDSFMDDQVDRAKYDNVTLYTVGLHGDEDDSIPEEKLADWAEETGGEYYSAEDPGELYDLFEKIAKEEIEIDSEVQVEISVTHERTTTSGYAVNVGEQTVEIDS
ncbi:von Willebrand factor A [Natrialba asiatica DSM 12278]|uniref:von Willebrand factor A n=1 Tax=Natrialba asiatica (strain ATCC 700177 / DSM 12278 / JCM 9576 / FERM P-10747 / NBRC 102637 / 172P1) TaxID=29540 RepID=M0B269_NATA1|nr:von Willebrand factor A [Natrialba asiatica DSM 12278]